MVSIEKRIAGSFLAISVLLFVAVLSSVVQIRQVSASSERVQNVLEPAIRSCLEMTNAVHVARTSIRDWVQFQEERYVLQNRNAWSLIDKTLKSLINRAQTWEDQEVALKLRTVGQRLEEVRGLQAKVEASVHRGDLEAAWLEIRAADQVALDEVVTELRLILDPHRWEMERVFVQQERQQRLFADTILGFLIVGVALCSILGIILTRMVLVPLSRTIRVAEQIAGGSYNIGSDLSWRDDKLSVSLRTMMLQLIERNRENHDQQQKLRELNESLQTLNAELAATNEELSQFSYRTSHDLKSPLVTARRLAEAVLEDIQLGKFELAKRNATRIPPYMQSLEQLVDDILSLTRADLEDTPTETLDVARLLIGARQRLENIYLEGGVELTEEVEPRLSLRCAEPRIRQVLENLISNAIKYSNPARERKYVHIRATADAGGVKFTIQDIGLGIPEKYQGRVFNMFERFHPRKANGSGLGLYIVRKHVDKLGGTIRFESSAEGTMFTVFVPGEASLGVNSGDALGREGEEFQGNHRT